MNFIYNEKIKDLISFLGTNYHNGENADKLETLIDGDINKKTIYGVLVSVNKDSHFYFQLYRKSTIWAYGQSYKDSAGSTPSTLFLYKVLDDNSEILIDEIKTKVDEWYLFYKDLDKGKYRIKSENYCQLTELYLELSPKYLLKQNNKYYTIKNNNLTLLGNQTLNKDNFEVNGFDNLNSLTQENTFYEKTKQNENNVFEYDLNKEIKKIETI